MSEHHYPDGFVLFLGTLFAPTQDRGEPGRGFTHRHGDVVTIATDRLGRLVNRVTTSREAPRWTFGIGALMRNLAARGLITDRRPGERRDVPHRSGDIGCPRDLPQPRRQERPESRAAAAVSAPAWSKHSSRKAPSSPLSISMSPAGEALVERLSPGAACAPLFARCDVTDIDAFTEPGAIADFEARIGGIDILVNNAANDDRHTIEQITPDYWDQRMAVNLRHQFFAAQAVAPAMKRAGGGVILNFGSISWHLALPELTLYQTAKAAIEGLTRSLARDLGRDNIRVNTIVPGNVQTPRQAKWYTA